jgi:GPH family glycoside/pentoside/hexuronide:cation symporter
MATIDPTRRARLPLATRMFSGVGTVMLYYNQVLGLSAAWVGTTIMIAMVADALFDPIVGHVSDNWRSRWGRRHPFMYASAIPLSICYFLVWAPPALDPAALSVYLLVIAILVRMIVSVYEIPSMALLSELSSDYDERTELVAWRYFFGVVGGIGITILTFKYFLVPTPSQPVGQLNPAGYFDYGIVASILIFVFVLASALGTHNRIPMLRGQGERSKLRDIWGAARDVFTNRPYQILILAMLLLSTATGLNNALGIYVNTYFWELSASDIALLGSAALIGVMLAFLVALPLSKRMGKKWGGLALSVLPVILLLSTTVARLSGLIPAHSPVILPMLFVSAVLTYACQIGGSILLVSMISDVTDQVRLSTGRQSEGLLFSVVVMINKAISGLGVLFAGFLLTAVAFPAKAQPGQVAESVIHTMVIAFVGLYLVFTVVGLLSLLRFPITRESHEAVLRGLEATSPGATPAPTH